MILIYNFCLIYEVNHYYIMIKYHSDLIELFGLKMELLSMDNDVEIEEK